MNFLKKMLFIYFQREGKEKERERNIHVWLPLTWPPYWGTWPATHVGCSMCPDWESNQRPFGSQPALNPLNYTSQGFVKYNLICKIT